MYDLGWNMIQKIQDRNYKDYKKSISAWGFDVSKHQPELLKAWYKFIQSGEIETQVVPSHIADSWIRSKQFKVDPFSIPPNAYLDQSQYLQRIRKNKRLTDIASPIIKNVFKSFGTTGYVIGLYDAEGYHLLILGQKVDRQIRAKYGLKKGLCFD